MTAALPRFCGYHKRTAQNGRFPCEPSVFSFHQRIREKGRLRHPHAPLRLLFLFCKKGNRPPFFKKRSKRKPFPGQLLFPASAGITNALHKTDGSHVNRPFFRSISGYARKAVCAILTPRCVFCFFSARKEIVLPSLKKEAKENHFRDSCSSPLLRVSQTHCTKRTVPMRTVRFSYNTPDMRRNVFSPKAAPPLSFVSFLQGKQRFPFFSFYAVS